MKFATILALTALSAPLAAQAPVWEDDFNDGVVDPMWTTAFNGLVFWNCGEFGGTFNFALGASPFGTFAEEFSMTSAVPAQAGALTFKSSLDWMENTTDSTLDVRYDLLDGAGNLVARIQLADVVQAVSVGGDMVFEAGGVSGSVAIPETSSADVEISRDAAGLWSWSMGGAAGSGSGALGVDTASVEQVKMYVFAIAHGFSFPPLPQHGEAHIDFVELYSAPTGPTLAISGTCPGSMTASVSNMTPNGPVVFARGGVGSTFIPNGACAGLSVPVSGAQQLATVSADSNGDASLTANAPAAACGAVSVVAVDGASCTATNVIAL